MLRVNFPDEVMTKLGVPVPNANIHDVSVSLPKVKHIEGLEDGNEQVLAQLIIAYPRLFPNPLYLELCEQIRRETKIPGKYKVFVFPSKSAASQCLEFIAKEYDHYKYSDEDIFPYAPHQNVTAVRIPNSLEGTAMRFRQQTGFFVSSRQAYDILNNTVVAPDDTTNQALRTAIGGLHGTDAEDVYLYPNGMNAIYAAYRAVTRETTTRTIQLGFPYVDTWRLQKGFGSQDEEKQSVYIRYDSPTDLATLRAELEIRQDSSCFLRNSWESFASND